jgi:hypothetical protein
VYVRVSCAVCMEGGAAPFLLSTHEIGRSIV